MIDVAERPMFVTSQLDTYLQVTRSERVGILSCRGIASKTWVLSLLLEYFSMIYTTAARKCAHCFTSY